MSATTSVVPCKGPKVTVELDPRTNVVVTATCHVGRCRWTYANSVRSDVDLQAKMHRDQHRRAVPATRVVHDVEWDVYCDPCGGHRRTFGTRTDADAWLAHHLSVEHGLVVCS